MKGEVRAFRPTLASFQAGRANARDSRLLERIQERNAQQILSRRREGKPLLYGRQASVLVLDTGSRKPLQREVEAVSFEGTGKTRGRSGPLATAVAAGLLAIIAPNLGNTEPTLAAATVVEADNPFGFEKGKTSVKEIGRLLGAKGIEEMEWVLDTHAESGRTTLLVADGVRALYAFDGQGKYFGAIFDFSALIPATDHDFSKAKNWTVAVGYLGRRFIAAENFLVRNATSGVLEPALFMVDADQEKQEAIARTIFLRGIINFESEGGFRNPRLVRKGKLLLLYADKDDGTSWNNIFAFDGKTGKYLGARKADKPFLQSVGLAMLTP